MSIFDSEPRAPSAKSVYLPRSSMLVAAVAGDAHVAGDDAFDRAVCAEDDIGDGEAGIDLDAETFGLLGEPAREAAEAAGIATVIAHERRHEEVRHADAAGLPQIVEAIFADLGLQRRAHVAPVGQEAVERHGIDHGARQDMRADLGALFEHDDGDVLALFARELLQPDRGGETGRAGADDHDVELHALAFCGFRIGRLAHVIAPDERGVIPEGAGIQYPSL
jgi:hypothetical protein